MVNGIFYVINTIVLIIAGIVVFKRYFSTSIKKNIEEQNRYLNLLRQEQEDLINSREKVELSIEKQESICKMVKLKVNHWKDKVDEDRKKLLEDREQAHIAIEKKLAVQSENNSIRHSYQEIAPQVIRILSQDLESYFIMDDNAKKYLDNIVNYIKKSNV